ncbi:MAG: AAA family ATPase [Microcoleaceae cyanobacterium]
MSQLVLMIGLPGSGKSFLANWLIQCLEPSPCLISTDQIRAQLFGDETIQGPWLKIWQQIRLQFSSTVIQKQNAIFDATNVQRQHRREVMVLARECGFDQITGLWVNTPLETCLKRNHWRDRQVPEEVILKMFRQLSGAPPSLSEDFDSLVILERCGQDS